MDQGITKAIQLFHKAAREVPAYKKFLRKNRFKVGTVHSLEDFKKIPLVDKKNYLSKYPLEEIFPNRKVPPLAYASSGSSGKPTFWFRGDEEEELGADIHELIFKKVFKINKDEPTLVIICFSMGVWVAGGFTLAACRELSRRGYKITTITPGMEKEDIWNALVNIAPKFKNLILAGYPPFLMDIVSEALSRKIKFSNKKIRAITAGDKFSETWRNDFLKLLKIKDPASIISIYGSADAGVLGFETPLSIFLRRESLKNRKLYEVLFGDETTLPALVQYDPGHIFFEKVGKEIVFTTPTAAPLIRYNIHDEGDILSFADLSQLLKKLGLYNKTVSHGLNDWPLPFIVKKGRADVAVTFYALNIYPENIKAGLEHKKISKLVSGQFLAFNKTVKKSKLQKLYIRVELAPKVVPKKELFDLIKKAIMDKFLKLNIEYRKLHSVLGKKAYPNIQLKRFGLKNSTPTSGGLLSIRGKKPKIVL